MRAVGEELCQPFFRFRHSVGLGHACDVEAARLRVFDQRLLDCGRVGQKSRSA